MPRSPRRRIGKGLYRDQTSLAAIVGVGSRRAGTLRQREHHYPLGTPLETLKRWQEETRRDLLRIVPASVRGSLAADVEAYLTQIQHLASWRERRAELRAWVARYGAVSRFRITAAQVRQTMGAWLEAGKAPKTINNRVQSLAMLYRTLDGRRVSTPSDEVTLLAVHKTPPIAVAPAIIKRVERRLRAEEAAGLLRDAKTRARFMVLAATGKRPSELGRAKPDDVDLRRRVWIVRDGKGGSSPGCYLNSDMLAAWRTFIEANAWGPFAVNSFDRVLHHCGWPKTVRPYNLRHSVGISLSEAGTDLADIQAHMGHRRIATTRAFYVPVLGSRLQRASESIDGRLGWVGPDNTLAPGASQKARTGHPGLGRRTGTRRKTR